jgi:hypothetical protein
VLSREEITAMEDAAATERDKLIVRVLADTGIRVGEMVNLTVHDLIERDRSPTSGWAERPASAWSRSDASTGVSSATDSAAAHATCRPIACSSASVAGLEATTAR